MKGVTWLLRLNFFKKKTGVEKWNSYIMKTCRLMFQFRFDLKKKWS